MRTLRRYHTAPSRRSPRWERLTLLLALGLVLPLVLPAGAVLADTPTDEVIVITSAEGIEYNGRLFTGRVEVRAFGDRIVLVEFIDADSYMRGIREVPASWHREALKAQAVAARTYLAWTLSRGRAGFGAQYGYDICATSACQVYRGDAPDEGIARWHAAVADTAGEILLYEGGPVLAMYSSTTGGRTRNFEDVFGGEPKPYLVAVPSPGERSPFVSWEVALSQEQMQAVFSAAEVDGVLLTMASETTEDGEGPWMISALFSNRFRTWTTWEFRGLMNQYGPTALPDALPWFRSDGRRVPQTILGPSYTVSVEHRPVPSGAEDDPIAKLYVFRGGGWGHDVGMSQYGALAMAESGSTYREILAHYYSGLRPESAGSVLPDQLIVGLAVTSEPIRVGGGAPITLTRAGRVIGTDAVGEWLFDALDGELVALSPWVLGRWAMFLDAWAD